jgi:chorismate-pyruvate lyase
MMTVERFRLKWLWLATVMMTLVASQLLTASRVLPDANWQDNDADRTELRVRLDDFNRHLLASTSATLTLENWCAEHHLTTNPKIVARVQDVPVKAISFRQRKRLKIARNEVVRYRRVALLCGDVVLSQADNWYVPSRLTAEMNHQLDTSDIPFGRAIRSLGPTRQTFSARILWSLSKKSDRKRSRNSPLAIPAHVIRHRALVLDAQGLPLAEVTENYTRAIVVFPEPPQIPVSSTERSSPNEIDRLNQHR